MTLTYHLDRTHPPAASIVGPALGIARADSGRNSEERLHHLLPSDRIPAHVAVVLLFRGDPLSSPDSLVVKSAQIDAQAIHVTTELRRFAGPLHANVVTIPILEVELGPLSPGSYDVDVELTELQFSDMMHPEGATEHDVRHLRLAFVVS